MSKIDELLKQLKQDQTPTKTVVVEKETVEKKKFPVFNIVLIGVILVMAFFLFRKETKDDNVVPPDPTPVVNVAEAVEINENLYSAYKAQCYLKIADLVENEQIKSEHNLKENMQTILKEARANSLGKLDQMDNDFFGKIENFTQEKAKIAEYLREIAKGFEEASK